MTVDPMDAASIKSLLAMVLVAILALVAMNQGMDGDLLRYAIMGILGLGGLEIYLTERRVKEIAEARAREAA